MSAGGAGTVQPTNKDNLFCEEDVSIAKFIV